MLRGSSFATGTDQPMANEHVHHGAASSDRMKGGAVDPVCGMSVDPHSAAHRTDHAGHTYYFCSGGCRTKFAADPQKYLSKKQSAAAVPEGAIYTCPMHPQIRQPGPGSCPICGMALEPEIATADAGPNAELADMTRRFWIGLVLSLPVVVLEMGGHLLGGHGWISQTASNWLQLLFATPVVLWAGWPFFVRGWQSLVSRNLNMFTLIAIGTGVAYGYSVVATLAPGLFPPAFRMQDGAVAVYFEAAAVITVLVLLGQVLELRAREATSGAIKALLDLAPKTARRVKADGTDEEVALDSVAAGDRLRVRPGDKVPVDGELLEGRSSLDESMVTGESMPVTKETGAKVIGGTLNQSGGFIMRADKVGRDTLLSQIVQMVAKAQRSRAPIQRLADQVSAWFVPAVIAVAVRGIRGVVDMGSGAAFRVRPRRCRERAHHRVPVRARPRNADVHHGGRRPRRTGRRPDQERRSPRTDGEGRHAGRRQDRHADGRQTEGRGDRPGGRLRGKRNPPAGCGRGARQRASARGRDRPGCHRTEHPACVRTGLRLADGQGRDRNR